jgi:hypothetical protein
MELSNLLGNGYSESHEDNVKMDSGDWGKQKTTPNGGRWN